MNFFRQTPRANTIEVLYGAIVAQARVPTFYLDYAVPDAFHARLDLLMLHLALVFERLSQGTDDARADGQAVFERFCRDVDDHLREQGVSDLKVPKEMRRVAEAFFGRHRAYISALRAGDDAALRAALIRNLFGSAPALTVPHLSAYVQTAMRALEAQDVSAIARGEVRWPDPDQISPPLAVKEL